MYRMMQLKDKILDDLVKEANEGGTRRLDGDRIDMVKDLAEAIYYCKVTEAMDKSSLGGYTTQPMGQGYGSMGYGAGTGSSAGYSMNQGYNQMSGHDDVMGNLRMKLQSASPDEREKLRNEVRSMMGMM